MGDLLVRASVWLAVACYPAGAYVAWQKDAGPRAMRVARGIWTVGCIAFVVHVASSFHVFYGWSHATAIEETARQTEELTGVRAGSGLWLNYVFAVMWIADVLLWWTRPRAYAERSFGVRLAIHSFFLFMIFNGAVVFVEGPVRVLGLVVTAAGIGFFAGHVLHERKA